MLAHKDNAYSSMTTLVALSLILTYDFVKQCFCSRHFPDEDSYGGYYAQPSHLVDVRSFGATGNGKTDDTQAFLDAWAAACTNQGSSQTILNVPAGWNFLVGPITFSGPCNSAIVIQLEGAVVSATRPRIWSFTKLLQWINIVKVCDFSITGHGTIDGQGQSWWNYESSSNKHLESYGSRLWGGVKPTAVRFYGSTNVTVEGININNSPQCHLKFDNCISVQVSGINVSSPGDSPNTDGIHLQNSRDVQIRHSSLACGDDCVSIQTGCSNIQIYSVVCGPSHGISIGSLGQDGAKGCVSNVTVSDCTLRSSLNGVRIKTWQGGIGIVKGVIFQGIELQNVLTGINIDQYYCGCGSSRCSNRSSSVEIKDVTFQKFRGSFVNRAVSLACSDYYPCTELNLMDIQLHPSPSFSSYSASSSASNSSYYCWNSYGTLQEPILPTDVHDCLRPGTPRTYASHTHSDFDVC